MTPDNPERGALILAGGRGERFWPWSTASRPKQLLPLGTGGKSLLAATFARAKRSIPASRIVVMTAKDLVDACRSECPGAIVVGEPMGRNTAPAIAAAAAFFNDHQAFVVMPSDHAIDDETAFTADLDRAFTLAVREPLLVTFGVKPGGPDTNYGYIQKRVKHSDHVHRVARFAEKPDLERAKEYVANPQYSWNSGIFVWGKRTFMTALGAGRPAVGRAFYGLSFTAGDTAAFEGMLAEKFPDVESISVDYAVLEK